MTQIPDRKQPKGGGDLFRLLVREGGIHHGREGAAAFMPMAVHDQDSTSQPIKNQEKIDANDPLTFSSSFLFGPGAQPIRSYHSPSGYILPPQLILSGKVFTHTQRCVQFMP